MTPGERKALVFLAGVGVLGGAARVLMAPSHAPTRAERLALAGQITAVDSARARPRAPRSSPARTAHPRGRQPAPPPDAPPPDVLPPIVDLDVADSAAIESLPGIGPALAQRIVLDRALHGPFGSLTGLDRVKGVGPKLAARLAPRVTFSRGARP